MAPKTRKRRVSPPTRLQIRRQTRGQSQEEVAKLLGMKAPSLSKYESGRCREFSLETEERLAEFYGITVAVLRREAGFKVRKSTREVLVPAERGIA